jgi:hypothetical protein
MASEPQARGPRLAHPTDMTINTTKDPRPDAGSALTIEPSVTSKVRPNLGVPHASPEPDLESRIKVCRAELVAQLRELKVDKRLEAREAGDKLKASLSELSHLLKWGIVDGWASLGDKVTDKLEHWLAESRRQLPTQSRSVPTQDGLAGAGQS